MSNFYIIKSLITKFQNAYQTFLIIKLISTQIVRPEQVYKDWSDCRKLQFKRKKYFSVVTIDEDKSIWLVKWDHLQEWSIFEIQNLWKTLRQDSWWNR